MAMAEKKMMLAVTIAEVSSPASPFILQGQPYVKSLEQATACGYEGIEIQLQKVEDLNRGEFFSRCDQMGLQLVSITTGLAVKEGLCLSSKDENVRLKTVRRLNSMIDLVADCSHHSDVMIGLLSGKGTDYPNRKDILDNLGRSLKAVSNYAEQKGVNINLEPVNHLDCPDGLNTWDETVWLLDRYECRRIFLGLDLHHMSIEEKDIVSTIRRYGNRIGSVQLMGRDRQAPGNEDAALAPVIDAIQKTGYCGPVTMECLPLPDPETALRKAAAFYRSAFNL